MAELSNCTYCGKVYVRTTFAICPTCRTKQDEKYERVYEFIRKQENREATVNEVHTATEVEEKLIYNWIKEGRLKTAGFMNLGYPCKSCSKPIQSGTLCESCGNRLQSELQTLTDQSKRAEEDNKSATYFTKG